MPNIARNPGDLLSASSCETGTPAGDFPCGIFSGVTGRTAMIAKLGDYVTVTSEGPGSRAGSIMSRRIWDLRQIDSAGPILHDVILGDRGINAHGIVKWENVMIPDLQLQPDGSITEPQRNIWTQLAGWGRGGMFAGWEAEFKWSYGVATGTHFLRKGLYAEAVDLQYGPSRVPDGINVYWQNNTMANIDVIGETGVVGHPFIFGNLLIFAGDQSDSGVVVYDISDPRNPVLLDFLNAPQGIGAYWAELWNGFLVMPRRRAALNAPDASYTSRAQFVDFRDPTNLRLAGELPLRGTAMYAQAQDGYMFIDRNKIHMTPLLSGGQATVELELDAASRGIDTSQFSLPLGNLLVSGGYDNGGLSQGASVWAHAAAPDNTGPSVSYHLPRDGEQNYCRECPISMLIHETIDTENLVIGQTLLVRPVGSTGSMPGVYSYNSSDVLTFQPDDDFSAGVEYEVILTEDAFVDAVGNSIVDTTAPGDGIAFRFTFRADSGSNPSPVIQSLQMSPSSPVLTGSNVQFQLSATDNDPLEYRIDFGDGAVGSRNRTAWGSVTSFSNTYSTPGTYRIVAQAREVGSLTRLSSQVIWLVVHDSVPSSLPQNSSTITLDDSQRLVWAVNPDNNRLSRINAVNQQLTHSIETCAHPSSVATDSQSQAWVTCRDSDQLDVFRSDASRLARFDLDYGSRPNSVVFDSTGNQGFASLEGDNRIARLSAQSPGDITYLPQRNGLNFELYSRVSSSGYVAGSFAELEQMIRGGLNLRRFSGIWDGPFNNEITQHVEDAYPRAQMDIIRGVGGDYSLIFRGQIEIQNPGNYNFSLRVNSDSGGRLSIAGQTIIDNAVPASASHPGITRNAPVTLSAGRHDIELIYYKRGWSGNTLRLEYAGPGISLQQVPASVLFPAQETRKPHGLAVTADGRRLLVTQLISDDLAGKIAVYDLDNEAWLRDVVLHLDEKSQNDGANGMGVPNYVRSVIPSFDGNSAWYVSKKDSYLSGSNSGGWPTPATARGATASSQLTFESSVRANLGLVDLNSLAEPRPMQDRLDIDNHGLPSAVKLDPLGTRLLVTMQANNELIVFDKDNLQELDRAAVGLAPSGVVIDPQTNFIYVKNLNSRSVTVLDGTALLLSGERSLASSTVSEIVTVPETQESLSAQELRGKQLFYSAREFDSERIPDNPHSRMAADGYVSCVTCHLDGGHDGRSWDISQFGEGIRNTITLRGRRGMGHGLLHWSANFDEVQDFEGQIRDLAGGTGFLYGSGHSSLGTSNSGLDTDLDALAAYVASLGREDFPKSPHRAADGSMSDAAVRGALVFESLSCGTCHSLSSEFTDSSLDTANLRVHDVGTYKGGSGSRLGGALSGFDTPTLLGLHATAPYLHDGTASTLEEVFSFFRASDAPGSSGRAHDLSDLSPSAQDDLMAYLLELDGGVNVGEQSAPTPTPTPSIPADPTPLPSIVPSITPNPSATASPSASLNPSPIPSVTSSPGVNPSGAPDASPSASSTPVPSPSHPLSGGLRDVLQLIDEGSSESKSRLKKRAVRQAFKLFKRLSRHMNSSERRQAKRALSMLKKSRRRPSRKALARARNRVAALLSELELQAASDFS